MNRTERQSIRRWFSPQMCYALAAILAAVAPAAAAQSSLNVIIQWNNAALQGVRDGTLSSPMVARALAILHTCMYDAWAAYDQKAIRAKRSASPRIVQPLSSCFPWDKATVFDPLMAILCCALAAQERHETIGLNLKWKGPVRHFVSLST
jgi:hypothetical protein